MLSFEEFVLKEAPKKIPDQQMGYDDKKRMDDLHFVLSNGTVVGSFNGLKIYQSKVGDLIIIGCIFEGKVIYSSEFKHFDRNTLQQVSIWRDKSNSKLKLKTKGITEHVVFNIVLKRFNICSHEKQTVDGNSLWTRQLLKYALKLKMKCSVVHTVTKQEVPFEDELSIEPYNDHFYGDDTKKNGVTFDNYVYKIYKGSV